MALWFDFKSSERLYLSNVSRKGVLSPSAIYSEAPRILSSFYKGRAQQITAFCINMSDLLMCKLHPKSPNANREGPRCGAYMLLGRLSHRRCHCSVFFLEVRLCLFTVKDPYDRMITEISTGK